MIEGIQRSRQLGQATLAAFNFYPHGNVKISVGDTPCFLVIWSINKQSSSHTNTHTHTHKNKPRMHRLYGYGLLTSLSQWIHKTECVS